MPQDTLNIYMKKFITTSLFGGVMFLASFLLAEDAKEKAEEKTIEPIQVVCPTTAEEEVTQPSDSKTKNTVE